MHNKKFDPKKLAKLNNPGRLLDIPPEYIAEKLKLGDRAVLVDIGAGTGFFSTAFLRQLNAEKVYACDISGTMLDWMRRNVVAKQPAVVPVQCTESEIPLDDSIAGLVFMLNLHHELERPAEMLAEARRLLKPDGKILIIDWKKADMDEGPPPAIRCSTDEVIAELAAAGFRQIESASSLPKHFMLIAVK